MLRDARLCVLTLMVAITAIAGCSEQIVVADEPAELPDAPAASWLDDGLVALDFTLRDDEGDDQDLRVEICEGTSSEDASRCGFPFQGPGSDGVDFVPTAPAGQVIPHRFVWDVGCGRVGAGEVFASALDASYVARVTVLDDNGASKVSAPFTLTELGATQLGACER